MKAGKITKIKFKLNIMMKTIELNPEWILTELSQSLYADGNGIVSMDTDNSTDASWIMLALNTLCIPYEVEYYDDIDSSYIDFNFRIEDIKINCPTLYKKMKEMDTKNKIYKHTNLN
jgi:hypothetical protein